ncbi:unnamed protein product [Angiostrongylus costaricensis]|uniref:Small nuclear RNA-activating complex polypeptide 3 n=1 Tax=Angiostrongylus costaricensis TaxID=334426 RepID=A0A0R3PAI5_ANGCS|nr:unnamed protein product [Angiostrongylus costaricensis]
MSGCIALLPPPEDRLKQWAKLEVLPDTEATAALAQLALHRPETTDISNIKKTFVPMKHDLKRSTSLEWSGKLFQVPTKPKLRFISYMDCQEMTVAVQDIDKVKEDLKTVSASLERKGICKQFAEKIDKENDVECKRLQRNVSAEELTAPVSYVVHKVVCERKLTPIPRDLVPPHPPQTVRYALFEPVNWIYDGCITEEEFDEKVLLQSWSSESYFGALRFEKPFLMRFYLLEAISLYVPQKPLLMRSVVFYRTVGQFLAVVLHSYKYMTSASFHNY